MSPMMLLNLGKRHSMNPLMLSWRSEWQRLKRTCGKTTASSGPAKSASCSSSANPSKSLPSPPA
ncbi:hypothetical protein EMIT0P4_80110 [Pseudomonas sp. IT-P4]